MELKQLVILDTDFLSYFLIEKSIAILKMEVLLEQDYTPITTAITKAEMYFGANKKHWGLERMKKLENLFDSLQILDFTSNSAEFYGKIRSELVLKGEDIGFADTAIASISLEHNAYILTNNEEHFRRIEGIKIIPLIET